METGKAHERDRAKEDCERAAKQNLVRANEIGKFVGKVKSLYMDKHSHTCTNYIVNYIV